MSRTSRRVDSAPVPATPSADGVRVMARGSEPAAATLARARLDPAILAAPTLRDWTKNQVAGEWSAQAVVDELQAQAEAASGNDLSRLEGMLTIQAHTLDALFNTCARTSALNAGEFPEAMERYMRLALRAQAQCRATIETLAEIKNPKSVAFVRQANIAGGHQQVNNAARAERSNQGNEILEGDDSGRWLEQGTQSEAILSDSSVATVGARDRAEVSRGQGACGEEQP